MQTVLSKSGAEQKSHHSNVVVRKKLIRSLLFSRLFLFLLLPCFAFLPMNNKTAPYEQQQDPSSSSSYSNAKFPPYKDHDEEDIDDVADYGIKPEDVQVSYARDFGLDDIPHVRKRNDSVYIRNSKVTELCILGLLRQHDECIGRNHWILWIGV